MDDTRRFTAGDFAAGGFGALAYAFVGWRYNMALAALIAPPLLMLFFRRRRRWYEALAVYPLLVLGSGIGMWKAWDLEPWMMLLIPCLKPLLLILPLYLDRWARKRLGAVAATLLFPAVMVALDFALSFSPFATVLSGVVGLYGFRELSQLASLAGIWGIGFVVYWLAPAFCAAAERGFDLRAAGLAFFLPFAVFAAALAFGGLRLATAPKGASTVRIAGVSAEHPRDYWTFIDHHTPREEVLPLRAETAAIQDRLFALSAQAAAAGARIVLWSEGACVLDEEEETAFVERGRNFARDHGLYLAAGLLVFHFGSELSDNKVLMFTPEGRLAFSYVKTISWYPTGSDGLVKVIDTPYGRLGTAICFDMDTPAFARRLATLGADIVLVPAYDSAGIRPFHTEVGLFRAVENGYSMFRQVAEGRSMAVDGRGELRAAQDYFAVADRLMFADLPVRGTRSLYALVGDLGAWADLALLALLLTLVLLRALGGGLRGGRAQR